MFPRSSKYVLFRLKAFLTFSAFLADIFTRDEKKLQEYQVEQNVSNHQKIISHLITYNQR